MEIQGDWEALPRIPHSKDSLASELSMIASINIILWYREPPQLSLPRGPNRSKSGYHNSIKRIQSLNFCGDQEELQCFIEERPKSPQDLLAKSVCQYNEHIVTWNIKSTPMGISMHHHGSQYVTSADLVRCHGSGSRSTVRCYAVAARQSTINRAI